MKTFVPNEFPTLGVEQEFHLISPENADLVSRCDEVMQRLPAPQQKAACHELFYSALELRSPVCRTAAEVAEAVRLDRQEAARACAEVGCKLVASGSHPFARWRDQKVVEEEHYQWVVEAVGLPVRQFLAFGLHVHVGVRSDAAVIYVMNEMARWLYPLLALSANSPFLSGDDTRLASARAHLFGGMPRAQPAPPFTDFEQLVAFHDKLRETGEITTPGDLWWPVRPQPPLGTIEVRIFDLPTDARRLVALAAIVQALVAEYQDRFEAGVPRADVGREYLQQNRWQAMRYGLDGKIVEPVTGDVLPMREQVARMLDVAAPKSHELDSTDQLTYARDVLTAGTEAQWQIERWRQLDGDLVRLELELAEKTLELAGAGVEGSRSGGERG